MAADTRLSPNAPPSDWDFWREGLDRAFFRRVYIRSTQLAGVATFLLLGFDQKPGALGILLGAAIGLFSLWTFEAGGRLLFNGGRSAWWRLGLIAVLKMPLMLFSLIGIAYLAQREIANAFAIVGGVLLIHTTMLVMVVATAMAHQDSVRERYR